MQCLALGQWAINREAAAIAWVCPECASTEEAAPEEANTEEAASEEGVELDLDENEMLLRSLEMLASEVKQAPPKSKKHTSTKGKGRGSPRKKSPSTGSLAGKGSRSTRTRSKQVKPDEQELLGCELEHGGFKVQWMSNTSRLPHSHDITTFVGEGRGFSN
jgi:hypothetical protein